MATRLRKLLNQECDRLKLTSNELGLPARTEEFHLFPNLPIELRHKIWGYAACQPRLVKCGTCVLISKPEAGFTAAKNIANSFRLLVIEEDRLSQSAKVVGQSRVPAILHVSVEARKEGFRYYWEIEEKARWKPRLDRHGNQMPAAQDDVGRRRSRNSYLKHEPSKFYVNFGADIFVQLPILQSATRLLKLSNLNFRPWAIKKIKKLQLTHIWTRSYKDLEIVCTPLFATNRLEELTIVIDFWSRGPREEENVFGHAQLETCKTRLKAGLQKLKRSEAKAKMPNYINVQWVSRSDIDLTAWSSDVGKLQVIDEALPPPVSHGPPFVTI